MSCAVSRWPCCCHFRPNSVRSYRSRLGQLNDRRPLGVRTYMRMLRHAYAWSNSDHMFHRALARLVYTPHDCSLDSYSNIRQNQVSGVSIYRLISMYNGSDSNTSAHARFAKPLETLRTSHYPETYSTSLPHGPPSHGT